MDASQIHYYWATMGTPWFHYFMSFVKDIFWRPQFEIVFYYILSMTYDFEPFSIVWIKLKVDPMIYTLEISYLDAIYCYYPKF